MDRRHGRENQKILDDAGILVTTIGNTEERPIDKSGIYAVHSPAPLDVMQSIVSALHIPVKETLPMGIHPATSTEILVILGDDFEE